MNDFKGQTLSWKLDGGIVLIYNLAKFLSVEERASLDAALA